MIEKQAQMSQGLLEQRNQSLPEINSVLSELSNEMEEIEDEEIAEHVKSWIEKA